MTAALYSARYARSAQRADRRANHPEAVNAAPACPAEVCSFQLPEMCSFQLLGWPLRFIRHGLEGQNETSSNDNGADQWKQ